MPEKPRTIYRKINILFTKTLKPVRRPLDAEFTHLFIHAGPGDAQGAGRLGDVPEVIAEGEDDGLRFAVLDDGLEFPVRARRFRDGLLAKFGGQIRQCDLIVLAQAQGPDEHVAQLHGCCRATDSA